MIAFFLPDVDWQQSNAKSWIKSIDETGCLGKKEGFVLNRYGCSPLLRFFLFQYFTYAEQYPAVSISMGSKPEEAANHARMRLYNASHFIAGK